MALNPFENIDPQYGSLALNPNAQRLTDEAYKRAMVANPESENQASLYGVDQTKEALPQAKNLGEVQNRMGMMADDSLNKAISDRARQHYETDINHLQRQTALAAPNAVSNRLNIAQNALDKKRSYDYGVYQRQIKQFQSEEQARNQAVSSILGVVAIAAL